MMHSIYTCMYMNIYNTKVYYGIDPQIICENEGFYLISLNINF